MRLITIDEFLNISHIGLKKGRSLPPNLSCPDSFLPPNPPPAKHYIILFNLFHSQKNNGIIFYQKEISLNAGVCQDVFSWWMIFFTEQFQKIFILTQTTDGHWKKGGLCPGQALIESFLSQRQARIQVCFLSPEQVAKFFTQSSWDPALQRSCCFILY